MFVSVRPACRGLLCQPPIFIPGHGGTTLVDDFTSFAPDNTPLPGAVVANLLHTASFGFMTMERGVSGWVIRSWDRAGQVVTTCTLFARKASCTPLASR